MSHFGLMHTTSSYKIGNRDVELGSDRGFDIPDSSSKLFGMVDFKTREEVASSAILYLATEEDIDPIT